MKKYLVPQSWQFFVDAAETLSLHDVAQKHGLAPSTVARRLSQLEKEVGGNSFRSGAPWAQAHGFRIEGLQSSCSVGQRSDAADPRF